MSMQQSANRTRATNDQEFAVTKASVKQQREKELVKEQLATLKKIDDLAEQYQGEGKVMDALQCMEKSLILRGHCFGLDSIEVYEACRTVGEMCNLLASACIQQEKFDLALELLKKAEVLTERHPAIRAVTFNNMCCYYKRKGKLRTALSYIERAIAIESRISALSARHADTHLNACTVLSELHRHEAAMRHAKVALRYLLQELFAGDSPYSKSKQEDASNEEPKDKKDTLPSDRVAVLAIAYHNLAVQQEYTRQYEAALTSYEKAVKVCAEYLGEDHAMHAKMMESWNGAKTKLQPRVKTLNSMNFVKRKQMPKGPAPHPQPLQRRELARLQKSLGIDKKELDYTGLEYVDEEYEMRAKEYELMALEYQQNSPRQTYSPSPQQNHTHSSSVQTQSRQHLPTAPTQPSEDERYMQQQQQQQRRASMQPPPSNHNSTATLNNANSTAALNTSSSARTVAPSSSNGNLAQSPGTGDAAGNTSMTNLRPSASNGGVSASQAALSPSASVRGKSEAALEGEVADGGEGVDATGLEGYDNAGGGSASAEMMPLPDATLNIQTEATSTAPALPEGVDASPAAGAGEEGGEAAEEENADAE